MSSTAHDPISEMQDLVRLAAGEAGSIKERISRAARRLDLKFSRARDLYYADRGCRVGADELERARHTAAAMRGTSDEFEELATLLSRMELLAARLDEKGLGDMAHQVRRAQATSRRALAASDGAR